MGKDFEFEGFEDTFPSKTFAASREKILRAALWLPQDAPPELLRKREGQTQRRVLVEDIIQAAAAYASANQLPLDEFERLAGRGVAVLDSITHALHPLEYDENRDPTEHWNFWTHEKSPMPLIRAGTAPRIYKDDIASAAADYHELPYRALGLERLLVDALIAVEMYAYGREMYVDGYALIGTRDRQISPVTQRHEFLTYLITLAVIVVLVGGIVAAGVATSTYIGETAAMVIAGGLASLLLLALAYDTITLPIRWLRQRRERERIHSLMRAMVETYLQVPPYGVISTRRLREVAQKADDVGVAWPSELFAILDDNIQRGGRL
jgi:hypothetical protein